MHSKLRMRDFFQKLKNVGPSTQLSSTKVNTVTNTLQHDGCPREFRSASCIPATLKSRGEIGGGGGGGAIPSRPPRSSASLPFMLDSSLSAGQWDVKCPSLIFSGFPPTMGLEYIFRNLTSL